MRIIAPILTTLFYFCSCSKEDSPKTADVDNTAVNTRDRDADTKTPRDQQENKSDVKITADIRDKITDTKMSTNAQNVKIVTENGKVTLRGPVKSQEEKDAIDQMAKQVAGEGNVDNQLEIEKG
jgi:osmotically-inducible protein OsmY